MQFIKKIIIALTLLVSLITFAQSETTWITKKKDKSKKVEKVVKKETVSSWIKKKNKENKKEFKKEKKKITKEVKTWISKKSKDKYLATINELPEGAIYISGYNEFRDVLIHGYVIPDTTSELINGYYKTSKGFVFFNDGKTICKIGSTVLIVDEFGEVTSRVSGKCTNKLEFSGKTTQKNSLGDGYATSSDGNKFFVNFNVNKTKIAKLYEENKLETDIVERKIATKSKKKIILDPKGKYYALLIGNSNYDDDRWDDLVSPVNDINAIKSVLDKSYKFEKIITVSNANKKQIFDAFKELSKLTTDNDYVLIYYSGHGKVKATQAYWIPKDGSFEWGESWINVNELNIFLTEIKAHHLAVMVDSCYVGGKFKGTNILDLTNDDDRQFFGESLSDALNLRARSVLSSGSSGRVSDTAPNSKNSVFALAFLNALSGSEKMSSPLNMLNIAVNVRRAFVGNFNQKPYFYHPDTWHDGGGDFIFIPKANLKK